MGRRFGLTILTSHLFFAFAAWPAETAEPVKVAPASSEAGRTVMVAPDAGYRAGWFSGFFLGEHLRNT